MGQLLTQIEMFDTPLFPRLGDKFLNNVTQEILTLGAMWKGGVILTSDTGKLESCNWDHFYATYRLESFEIVNTQEAPPAPYTVGSEWKHEMSGEHWIISSTYKGACSLKDMTGLTICRSFADIDKNFIQVG